MLNISAKLLKFQKLGISVKKDSTNPAFKSKYASLPEILETVTPKLSEIGLIVVNSIDNGLVVTEVVDTESGEKVTASFPLFGQKAQEFGSSITYARRYNLGALLNLHIDDDDDGNAANNAIRSQYDQTDDKPWFNAPQIEALRENLDKYPSADDAIKAARTKYKVSKKSEQEIRELFE